MAKTGLRLRIDNKWIKKCCSIPVSPSLPAEPEGPGTPAGPVSKKTR